MAAEENREFHPEMTGIAVGPNEQPADNWNPLPTEVPEAATAATPGPEQLTDEVVRKDHEARTGRDGLGSAGRIHAEPVCPEVGVEILVDARERP